MRRSSFRTISEMVLIALFLILIFAPPIATALLPGKEWSNNEKRLLTSFPRVQRDLESLMKFPVNFEAFYRDHFGFRETLIQCYNMEMAKRFGLSSVREILKGKNGWYFYVHDDVIKDFRGVEPLTPQELMAWKLEMKRKQEWLARHSIRFLFVLAPSKLALYPEYLPDHFRKAKGETRVEQLMKYLEQSPDLEVLNPQCAFEEAKSEKQLYLKADTHWNRYGAFIAYTEIMNRIAQWFPQENFKSDFFFLDTTEETSAGDIIHILGLQDTMKKKEPVLKDRRFCAQTKELKITIENFYKIPRRKPFAKGCCDAKLRAVVFRDSFFTKIEPYFSENFHEVIYIWQHYDQETMEKVIEYFDPHLVIEERAERFCFKPWSYE